MPLTWDDVTGESKHIQQARRTFEVKSTGFYPRAHVDTAKVAAVGQAGGVLLTETIRAAGLDRALSEALAGGGNRWRSMTPAR